MPKDIFEDAPITLKGEITSGHASASSVSFLLKSGGAVLRSVGATLDGKKAEAVTPAPKVPDDVERVDLDYALLVDGKEYPGGDGFRVWPRDFTLKILRDDDKTAPFDGFRVKVTHEGERSLRTLPDGTLRVVRTKPATVTVAAEEPFEVVTWTDDKGRARAGFGRRAVKAAIVSPEKPSTGDVIEQRVNARGAAEGVDGLGHVVTVTVCVDGDQRLGPGERTGKEGDFIFVEATFGRESKRNAPRPDLRGVLSRTASPDGKKITGKVRLGPQGEPARFELVLGKAGGDTCTLKVGGTAAVGDDQRKFTNWRVIHYQLSRPGSLSLPDLGPPTQGLEKVFVKWEKYHEETFQETTAPTPPPGAWFDGDHVGLSGRALCVSPEHNAPFFHFLYRDEKRPLGMHLLLTHLLVRAGTYGSQMDHVTSPSLTAASTITFPPTGSVVGWTFDVDPAKDKLRGVFRVSFQDGGIPVRNAVWRSAAATGANVGKTGLIPEDLIHIPKPTGRGYKERNTLVHFALPPDALLVTAAGDPVVIEADVVWAAGPIRGVAMGNDYLALREAPSDDMGGTLLHEIGHAIEQAVAVVPPGLSASEHGRQYTGRGHTGPHCAFGVADAAFNAGNKTALLLGRTDAQCVMFGESTGSRPVAFCAKCEPFARAYEIESMVDP